MESLSEEDSAALDADYTHIVVEQYAEQVLDFSTQYGSDSSISYTANNILGLPSKFPSYGDFPQTFVMRDYGKWWDSCPSGEAFRKPYPDLNATPRGHNFIDLKYEHAVYPFRIHIYETFNPGSVVAIWAGNCRGRWKLLWYGATSTMAGSRVFSPPITATDFPVKQIRLEFNQQHLPYYAEIDAVALLGTVSPLTNEARLIQSLPDPKGPILEEVLKRKLHLIPKQKRIYETLDMNLALIGQRFLINDPSDISTDNGLFSRLPRELILNIFSNIDLISLMNVSQVCKLFQEVSHDPMLYTSLTFKNLFHCVTNATLDSFLSRSSHLQYLDLSWCGNYGKISPSALKAFIEGCGENLLRLRFANCHVATQEVIWAVSNTCRKLVELNMSNCHLLNATGFTSLKQLTSLKYLNLHRTNISQTELCEVLRANRGLHCLNISACTQLDADEVCRVLSEFNSDLRSIDLWKMHSLSMRGALFLAKLSNIEELDLGWCLSINSSTGCIRELVQSCPKIVKLFLTAHRSTSDNEILVIADNLPRLRQLDILGNRNVTTQAISYLLSRCSSMELLDIGYCEQMDYSQVQTWKTMYPKCHIITS